MKRIKALLISILVMMISFFATTVNAEDEVQKLRAGAFFKALNVSEISTFLHDMEDEIVFINAQDLYVFETNAIPENSKIYGLVEDILEPIQGRNGAIKILIYKIITPDKKVYRVKGHVYTENDNYIGGEQTQSIYYKKTPYYMQGIRPILKATPLNIFEMGKHTVLNPGSELFIILDEDMILK